MPVKRRTARRRAKPAAELEAWACYFDAGADYFNDLPSIGVPLGPDGRPDRAVAAEAWRRLGTRYLADPEPKLVPHDKLWALREFGEPGELGGPHAR